MDTRKIEYSLKSKNPMVVGLVGLVLAGIAFYVYRENPARWQTLFSIEREIVIPEETIRRELGDTLLINLKGDLIRHALVQDAATQRAMLDALNAGAVLESAVAKPQGYYPTDHAFWNAHEDRDLTISTTFLYGTWTAQADFSANISRRGSWTVYNPTHLAISP